MSDKPRGVFGRIAEKLFKGSRSTPVRTDTQARLVRDKVFKGDTKAMAAAYGVTPRTVQRWAKGDRKNPPPAVAARLADDVARVHQPRVRERAARQMEREHGADLSPVTVQVSRAHNFTIGGSSAIRDRTIEAGLTGEEAAALTRAKNDDEIREAVRPALARYFNQSAFSTFAPEMIDFDPSDVDIP